MSDALKATTIQEGGVVVRGTDVPRKARTEALRAIMDRGDEDFGPEWLRQHPDFWVEMALGVARNLRDHKPEVRQWRWNPCNPRSCWDGGGHRGHLEPAYKPGPGVWTGVYWTEVG